MRSTWELLSVGWQRLRSDLRLWLRLVAFQVLMTLVVLAGLLLVFLAAFTIIVVVIKAGIGLTIVGSLFAGAISVVAVGAAVYFLGGAYLSLVVAAMEEKRLSVTEYYRIGRQHVWKLITSQLWLLLGIFLLLCLPLFLLLVAYGIDSTGLVLVSIVLIMAAVIAFSLVVVRFAILPYVVIGENLGGKTAVRRAWRLTHGRWWKTLLVIGATQLVALLLGVVDGIGSNPDAGTLWTSIWALFDTLATLALTVWTLLVLHEYYRDLVATAKGRS